ncbi:MFS transporter [Caballeronia sp. LZ035]|uniref:MFS transporter n=1 Tax=Caballeronia sp. LZ035 TaxID=3038568 RepID=UPI0028654FF0|nr:MFS transporter [Caballeronia sp. LZ035]MDR5759090.1 MFS transporter [Caballeronia sp. LZ035]
MLRLMPVLMLMYVVAHIDRSNVGFAKLGFMRDLGITDTLFGVGAGIFYAGYMIFEIPSNLMLSRVGARRTFIRIMTLWAICSCGLAAMSGPKSFLFWRFLLGASEAGLFPGVLLYITYWVPEARRARFTAMFVAAIPISGIIGGPISGILMRSMENVGGFHGWQWLFFLEGMPALVLVVIVLCVLCDGPSQARWLTQAEAAVIERDLEADRNARRADNAKSFLDAMRSPQVYCLTVMAVALLASTSNFFFWLPSIIRRTGVTDVWTIGMMSSMPFAAGFVGQYLVARHSDFHKERRWHAVTGAAVSALGWCALSFTNSSAALSLLVLTITAVGTFSMMAPFWAMPSEYLGEKAAAGGIAAITTLAGIGSVISPMIIGWLNETTRTLAAGQYYLAALLFVGSIAIVAMRPVSRRATSGTR